MIPPDVANTLRAQLPTPQNAAQPTQVQPLASAQRINDFLSDLAPGQRVLAEIQALLPNGAYRAVVAQRNITLALPFSAKPGDSLELEVVETEGKLALAFVGDRSPGTQGTPKQESVATSLSQTGKMIGDLLGGIDNQGKRAPPVPLNGSQPLVQTMPKLAADLAPVLKQALTQSGMFYEAHQARWVAGELPTARLLQEPQGRLSQTRASTPGAGQIPFNQPVATSPEPSRDLPAARGQVTPPALPIANTGSRPTPDAQLPASTQLQTDTKAQGTPPPSSTPQLSPSPAVLRGTPEYRALNAYHQQASLTRESPSIRQTHLEAEASGITNTSAPAPASIAKTGPTSPQVPTAGTGGPPLELPSTQEKRVANAYSQQAAALPAQAQAVPLPREQSSSLPAASLIEHSSPLPEQISPPPGSEASPEAPLRTPSGQNENLSQEARPAPANTPANTQPNTPFPPHGTQGPIPIAQPEASPAPTPPALSANAPMPMSDSAPSGQVAVPEGREIPPPVATAQSEHPQAEIRPSTGQAPSNAPQQQGVATEPPGLPQTPVTQSGTPTPPASSPTSPQQPPSSQPPFAQKQESPLEPMRLPPEGDEGPSQVNAQNPTATGDVRQGAASVNQADQAYRQLEQSTTGRGPQSVSPGLPPELAPLVQQQLDALATQTFAWQGQIWPGQQMFWEIDEQQGRQGKGRDEPGGQWETRLKLKLPLLGDIEASLHLRPGNEIGISLSVKQESSGARLESASQLLKQQFEAAGLNLTQFSVKNDTPTQ